MAREYVSRLGRFSALDPAAAAASDPQSMNRYSYVENDPVNNIDPTGQGTVQQYELYLTALWWMSPLVDFGFGDNEFEIIELALTPTGYQGWLQDGFLVDPVPIYGNMSALGILGLPMNGGAPSGPGQGMDKAKLTLLKPDCAKFIMNVVLGGYNAVPGGNPEDAFQGAMNMPLTMVQTLAETTYTNSSANPTEGGYTTYASTDAGTRAVTLYAGYSQLSPTEQGQTLIHEGVHDASGLGDQALAQAATGNVYADTPAGRAQASDAFQKELKKHCK